MSGMGGLGAGMVLVGINTIFGVAGWWLGTVGGSATVGLVAGLAVGLVLGITTIYFMYVRPMQESARNADYSHLPPRLDDD